MAGNERFDRSLAAEPAADALSQADISGVPPEAARLAVTAMFFVNGLAFASWVPHIPAVKLRLALNDAQLGLVLLVMAFGAVMALLASGRLVDRFGARRVTGLSALGFSLALPLLILAPNVAALCLALWLFGALNATLDVAMNAQGVEVERRYGRSIMSSFHGFYSVGGLVGAGLASFLLVLGVQAMPHTAATAAAGAAIVLIALPFLLPSGPTPISHAPLFTVPHGAAIGLGLLAFLGLLTEGAVADWSAVYLSQDLQSGAGMAGMGFAAFSLAMAVGRFGGDHVVDRFGPHHLLRACALLAALGLAIGLSLHKPLAAIVGFGIVGLGVSNVIPVLFSAAGRLPGREPAHALAAVASVGYFGFLAGPPLIGLIAEFTSLRFGLGLLVGLCLAIAAGASIVTRTSPRV